MMQPTDPPRDRPAPKSFTLPPFATGSPAPPTTYVRIHELVRESAGGRRPFDLLARWDGGAAPGDGGLPAPDEDEGGAESGDPAPPLDSTAPPAPLFRGQPRPAGGRWQPPRTEGGAEEHEEAELDEEGEYGEEEEEEEEEYEDEEEWGGYGERIEWYAPVSYARACGGTQEAWLVLIQGWAEPYVIVPADSPPADFLVRYTLLHTVPPYAAPKPVDPETWRRFFERRQGDPTALGVPPPDRERELAAALRRHNGAYIHLGGQGGNTPADEADQRAPGSASPHLPSSDELERIRRDLLESRLIRFMLAPTHGADLDESEERCGEEGYEERCGEEGYEEGGYDADAEQNVHSLLLHREMVHEWADIQRAADDPRNAEWVLPVLEEDVLSHYEDDEYEYEYDEYEGGEGYDDALGEFVHRPPWRGGLAARNPYVRYVSRPLTRASAAVLESARALGQNAATHFRRLTEEEIDALGAHDPRPGAAGGDMEGAFPGLVGGEAPGLVGGEAPGLVGGEDTRDRAKEARRALRAGVQSLLSTFGWAEPPVPPPRSASWVPTAGGEGEGEVDAARLLRVGDDPYGEPAPPQGPEGPGGEDKDEDGGGVPTLFPLTDRAASAEELSITEGAWCRMTVHEFACWRCESQAPLSEALVLQHFANAAPPPCGGVRWMHDALGNDPAAIDALRRAVRANAPAMVALGDSVERLLSICSVLVGMDHRGMADNAHLWELFQNAAAAATDSHYRCMARGRLGAPDSSPAPPTPPTPPPPPPPQGPPAS